MSAYHPDFEQLMHNQILTSLYWTINTFLSIKLNSKHEICN